MTKYNRCKFVESIIYLAIILLFPLDIWAQENQLSNYNRDTLITGASETWAVPNVEFKSSH